MNLHSLMRTKSKTLNYHQKASYQTRITHIHHNNLVIEFDICNIFKNNDNNLKQYKIIKPVYEKRQKGVYIVESKKDHKKYVIKVKSHDIHKDQNNVITILKNISHYNIAKFIDSYHTNDYDCYIYEYITGTTLYNYVNKFELTEKETLNIFSQIVNGVKFLHDHNILHCDLKPENIIYEKATHRTVIIDYDLAHYSSHDFVTDNNFGTVQYMSPESYDLGIYSKKADIWSLGIILYFMITKKFPFNYEQTIDNSYNNLYRRNHFKYPDIVYLNEKIKQKNFSDKIPNLISKMLEFEDNKRITIDELINIEI